MSVNSPVKSGTGTLSPASFPRAPECAQNLYSGTLLTEFLFVFILKGTEGAVVVQSFNPSTQEADL